MYRRQFLRYLSGSGLGLALPMSLSYGQSSSPNRFWITVNAGGGWDPTYFVDQRVTNQG